MICGSALELAADMAFAVHFPRLAGVAQRVEQASACHSKGRRTTIHPPTSWQIPHATLEGNQQLRAGD